MPELWAGWQRLCNPSWVRRGSLALCSKGQDPAPGPRRVMPQPGPPHHALAVTITSLLPIGGQL